MIHNTLFNPKSIAVIGGSDDCHKPGGKVLKNLIDTKYKGSLYVVNPKALVVQGIKSYSDAAELPQTDLAILAVSAEYCPLIVEILASQKNTKSFIILSAGFSEDSARGAELELQIVETVNKYGASLIGPNCIGVLTPCYSGVFTTPLPILKPKGCDLVSGSGATALFIIESGIPHGLPFTNVFSVGNSAQLGVEQILQHLDQSYNPQTSADVKLLYIESITNPQLLLKHASSLIKKGCRIAAIKSGSSDAGSRAATSHTGALANSDTAVDALFKKAGIVRCYSRQQLVTVAGVMLRQIPKGNNIAIITHAGGPAVMLTDTLSKGGFNIPNLSGPNAQKLLAKLFKGSSVTNPIDFLATGTAQQLAEIIDACENDFDQIDAMCVIFGSPGLFPVYEAYNVLHQKIEQCKKIIYPVLPSGINAKNETAHFISLGHNYFPDEVKFAEALIKVANTKKPQITGHENTTVDITAIRQIIQNSPNGYMPPQNVQKLLDAAQINRATEIITNNVDDTVAAAQKIGFPLVMKVVGPVHKSDVGGVVLNINNIENVKTEFNRMIKITDATGIMLQPQLIGNQLFVGALRDNKFGHLIMCGLGGIYIEILNDIQTRLAPVNITEAHQMIQELKTYKIIQGARQQEPVNQNQFAKIICQLSALCIAAPEISELDLNPLLGNKNTVTAVDARVKIDK